MQNIKHEFAGKRVINHARCSTDQQVKVSIARQLSQINEFCESTGMIPVGEERLEGVSGLDPTARDDIDRLIQRKREDNDFDAVVLSDVDRLTRAGVEHAFYLKYVLQSEGIEIIFARHDIPTGPLAWLSFGMKSAEANSEVNAITKRMVEGYAKALLDGRAAHVRVPPYGCDKLVSSADGSPINRVRKHPNGSWSILSPDGQQLLRTLGRKKKNEEGHQFKTVRTDRMTLVPGEPVEVMIVQEIYRLRYTPPFMKDGRISRHLNDLGLPSPSGRRWTRRSITKIYSNPTYLGVGIANQSTGAKLRMGGGKSITSMIPPAQHFNGKFKPKLKSAKPIPRDPIDWVFIPYPAMAELISGLSQEVREAAYTWQIATLENTAHRQRAALKSEKNAAGRKSGGSRHNGSPFFLRSILKCATEHAAYVGYQSRTSRRYGHSGRTSIVSSDRPMINVPAENLEGEVLRVIGHIIQTKPNLREEIVRIATKPQLAGTDSDEAALPRLRRQHDELLHEIALSTKIHRDLSDDQVAALTDPLKQQLRAVTASLEKVDREMRNKGSAVKNAALIADRVMARLQVNSSLGRARTETENAHLRDLSRLLIHRLTVHPDTLVIEAHFAIPSWVDSMPESGSIGSDGKQVGSSQTYDDKGNLVPTSQTYGGHEKTSILIDLGRFSATLARKNPKCKGHWAPFRLAACS